MNKDPIKLGHHSPWRSVCQIFGKSGDFSYFELNLFLLEPVGQAWQGQIGWPPIQLLSEGFEGSTQPFPEDIRELKQTDAAAERRRSTSKFLFRRTQGQVNLIGPWHHSLFNWMEIWMWPPPPGRRVSLLKLPIRKELVSRGHISVCRDHNEPPNIPTDLNVSLVYCKSLQLIKKQFLDLRNMLSNQENVGIFFSKQEILYHWKLYLSLLRENLTWIERYISKQEQILSQEKPFLARRYFLFQEKQPYSETIFINRAKNFLQKGQENFFLTGIIFFGKNCQYFLDLRICFSN